MTTTFKGWTRLYSGVDWLALQVPFSHVPFPSTTGTYCSVNILRICLKDPNITTTSTAKSALSGDGVTLRDFLTATYDKSMAGVVGINANYFDYSGNHKRNCLKGLAISSGEVVSEATEDYISLLIDRSKCASFWPNEAEHDPNTWTAVSGNRYLLSKGAPTVEPPTKDDPAPIIAARTAIGLSSDRSCLFLATIDGLETDPFTEPYYGASFYDIAAVLLLAGATDAINMDGGGSTTMGRCDAHGFVPMNEPHGRDLKCVEERAVGNCFAVVVRK